MHSVLGIFGSPRKDGNSDLLLESALTGAQEGGSSVMRVYCRQLKISGCLECGGCDKTGVCVVKDDMHKVYPLFEQADSIIMSAPIFFYGIPAQAKALVDRAQAPWSKRLLAKPRNRWGEHESGKGYLIAVGATKGANLFEGTELLCRYFYDALDMSYEGALLVREIEGKGIVKNHPDYLQQAFDLGKNIAAE